jgi:hypothetical protein
MKNKGQTAMEYLMTYGWAILIIIVVVAALYAMGIFNIKGGVTCSPCFSYFAFRDFDKGTGIVYLRNGARTIDEGSIVPAGGTSTDCAASDCDPGADMTFTLTTNTGNQVISIQYTDSDSGVDHTDTATIHTGN